eukprot:TRINITY_DN7194_c0_g1_i5.p1 TRINITY_DN7194_c0_g1~~TRINITY_DN7194_c0_g1_i5.p1  ORF type:complete len:714 (+),score=89.61 TRINITY_DN7194_c0_g1_i5:50-2191(+)
MAYHRTDAIRLPNINEPSIRYNRTRLPPSLVPSRRRSKAILGGNSSRYSAFIPDTASQICSASTSPLERPALQSRGKDRSPQNLCSDATSSLHDADSHLPAPPRYTSLRHTSKGSDALNPDNTTYRYRNQVPATPPQSYIRTCSGRIHSSPSHTRLASPVSRPAPSADSHHDLDTRCARTVSSASPNDLSRCASKEALPALSRRSSGADMTRQPNETRRPSNQDMIIPQQADTSLHTASDRSGLKTDMVWASLQSASNSKEDLFQQSLPRPSSNRDQPAIIPRSGGSLNLLKTFPVPQNPESQDTATARDRSNMSSSSVRNGADNISADKPSTTILKDTPKRNDCASGNRHAAGSMSPNLSTQKNYMADSKACPSLRSSRGGKRGLCNLGNTCYMNAVLQCLSQLDPLVQPLLELSWKRETADRQASTALADALANVLHGLWDDSTLPITPRRFKRALERVNDMFYGYYQHDAQELLRSLLFAAHDDLNRRGKADFLPAPDYDKLHACMERWQATRKFCQSRDDSLVLDCFQGWLKSTLQCTHCKTTSSTFEPFLDLSIPVAEGTSEQQLQDCLNMFGHEETLENQEAPLCDRCKRKTSATKRLQVVEWPHLLVLHLKRFVYNARDQNKVLTRIHCPLELNVGNSDSKGSNTLRYELCGLVNHSGSLQGGHYTAQCKHACNKQWYEYNDAIVEPIATPSRPSSKVYLAFYLRN